ncbi:hypothetical protein L3i20_v236240 [Paenibacillus sp. L3-i20]|nr:hypothetical protein L3i20_v236240 [Paenibacillus sp. L3-i20]
MGHLMNPNERSSYSSFAAYLFHNSKDNVVAALLLFCFSAFYIFLNMPYVTYIDQNSAVLSKFSPFYGAPFTLNLFNFDPSFYYGYSNVTVIHPIANLLAGSLAKVAEQAGGNLFFLVLQSALNAFCVVLLYYYLRRRGEQLGQSGFALPLSFAAFFGVSSYSVFSALIPDSYAYAQFVIIISVVYLAYGEMTSKHNYWSMAVLAFLNFAITSTNIATYFGAMFVSLYKKTKSEMVRPIVRVMVYSAILVVLFSGLQLLLFDGKSWFNNVQQGLSNGGFSYVASFSLSHHWKSIYMLFISPVLSPEMVLLDPGIVAFTTNLSVPYPLYVTIIGFVLLGLAIAGFIRGIRTKQAWMLAVYIGFAIALHIVVGYGLATFNYDLYLYAGHYLFAIFLLAASFIMGLKSGKLRKIGLIIIMICTLVTLGNNVIKHTESLDYIRDSYVQLNANKETGASK